MKFNLKSESINYIKILYNDNEDFTHCTKASVKRIDEHEIFACSRFDEGLYLKTPQDVSVSFVCENGLYRAKTVLKYVQNEEPYTFFSLKTPEEIEYQQNREYFRVKMEEDVLLSFDHNVIPCKIYDISANGIKLKLDKEIELPEDVHINILFQPHNIEAQAKFVRIDKYEESFLVSLSFIDLSEHDRDKISQKCFQIQLEHKRNSVAG